MNYSDPVVYQVDYVQMCILTKYRTAYNSGQQYTPEIFWTNFALQAITTVITILAGYGGKAAANNRNPKLNYRSPTLGGFIVDFVSNMFWESVFSSTLQLCGMNAQIAQQLSNILSLDLFLRRLTKGHTTKDQEAENKEKIRLATELTWGVEDLVDSGPDVPAVTSNRQQASLWTRIRAYFISRQIARTFDLETLTELHNKLSSAEVRLKAGDTRNVVETLDAMKSILHLDVRDFPNAEMPLAEYRKYIQVKLMTALIEGGSAAVFQEIINDPLWKGSLGLGEFSDGSQFQYFEFTSRRRSSGDVKNLVLNYDGEGNAKIYRDGKWEVMDVDEVGAYLKSMDMGKFLDQFSTIRCKDPHFNPNAPINTVYLLRDSTTGDIVYVGRTSRDPKIREAEHRRSLDKDTTYMAEKVSGLTWYEAKGLEQALLLRYGGLGRYTGGPLLNRRWEIDFNYRYPYRGGYLDYLGFLNLGLGPNNNNYNHFPSN